MGPAADTAALTGARILILLTRVVPRTKARTLTRQALTDSGHHVFESEVRQSQALALGRPIGQLGDYTEVLDEMTALTHSGKRRRRVTASWPAIRTP